MKEDPANQSTKNSKKVKNKILSHHEFPGQSVHTANIIIDASKVKAEILNQSKLNPQQEFANSDDGIEGLCLFLRHEQVKGARLTGTKNNCNVLALELLKRGIRPLITNAKHTNSKKLNGIPVINEYVAGIDIGKKMIMVAVPPGLAADHTKAFETYTEDLEEIVMWLKELNITEVAMESTSVYWIPLFDLCEQYDIKPLIVNPKHVKTLPGRKTDVLDAQWLMRLLACGLLQGGFIPPKEIRALRDLARYRQDLMDRAGDSLNRMHKALSVMNVQLGNVISDISGKSGMDIIRAIVKGMRNPKELAFLANKRCKVTYEELVKALQGTYDTAQVFLLEQELNIYDYNHSVIIETEKKIKELLEQLPDVPSPQESKRTKKKREKKAYNRSPYCFDLRSLLIKKFGRDLTIIPGIEEGGAATVLFETGGNVDAFPTLKHFASWSAVCPGNKISGGKMLSGKSPKKFSRVGQVCRIAAHANYQSDSAIGAQLRRYVRNGKSKKTARKATAHKINAMIYNALKYGQEYVEKGAAAYEKVYEERRILSCIKTLTTLGLDCSSIVRKKVA